MIIGVVLLIGGCGWATLYYESPVIGMVARGGVFFVSAGWAEYDTLTGSCELKTGEQVRRKPLDSLLFLRIFLVTGDTLQPPEYVQEHYDISHIWVTTDTSRTPTELDACKDSSAVYYSDVFKRRVATRDIWFGPMKVFWPFPKFIFASGDIIYRDPDTGAELSRERLHFEIRREKESILESMWNE